MGHLAGRVALVGSVSTIIAGLAFSAGVAAQDAKGSAAHIKAVTSAVDGNWIKNNAATSKDWPAVGLDFGETRFSKLDQINAGNVKNLGLAWSYDLESARGVEATPIVVDGIMYVSAPWSVVHAIDARTGKKIWTFDPEVARDKGYRGCCDVVNRGVALHKGKVFVGAYDGRLIALDAASGKKVWEKDTIIDHKHSYTITGAPRVANGKVIIGNGGAEYGVRGYVTAYDAETGSQAWRWFVVPGDPEQALRGRVHGGGRQDLGPRRQVLGERRRRHGVGQHHLRPRPQHGLSRHRQRLAVEPQPAQPGRRRQSLSRLDRRAQRRYRQIPVALPGDARRQLGLHIDPADDPGRHHDRWRAAQGHPACAEERLLLRHRPHQRQVHLGQELRRRELGHRLRRQWPADRGGGRALAGQAVRHRSRPLRRAQLASDVVQSQHRAGLPAGAEHPGQPDRPEELEARRQAARRIHGQPRLERRLCHQRDAAQGADVRPADRLGSGEAEGGLAPGACLAVERRHAHDRGQPRVPGHGRRPLRRLQRHDRREAVGVSRPAPAWWRPHRPTWSTASSTCRWRWAGAACTA